MTKRKFNSLKSRALAVFAQNGGWLSPLEWALLARFRPARAAYSYLLRLHGLGLLERRRDARGLLAYRLSRRGRDRLAWLIDRAGARLDYL